MTDAKYVRTITRLTDRDHDRLAKYYAELAPSERLAVHGLHTRVSQQRRAQKDPRHAAAFFHATFLLAIRKYKAAQNPDLSSRMTTKEAATTDLLQKTHKKARPGRKASRAQVLVERNYHAIREGRLKRPKPEPWRRIADKLSVNGQRISHTALKNLYEKLAAEGEPKRIRA